MKYAVYRTVFFVAAFSFGLFLVGNVASADTAPVPVLTSISPASAVAGGSSFTMVATGTDFSASSLVYLNGSPLTTSYVSSTTLTASVPAASVVNQGAYYVYVVTPAPGGGQSNSQPFAVYANTAYNAYDVLGQLDASGNPSFAKNRANNTPNANGFSSPQYIAMDSVHHRLFVSDTYRVVVYNLDSSNDLIDRIADNVIGKSDFNTAGVVDVTASNLSNTVTGLAYDSVSSRLFVADNGNNRVLVYDVATITNGMSASYVLGQASFAGSGAATTATGMNQPRGLIYDATSTRLFAADTGNNRVLVYDTSSLATGMSASFFLGQTTSTASGALTTASGMNGPYGLTYDGMNSRLFVADRTNHRVTVFNVASGTLATGMSASFFLGQTTSTLKVTATTQSGMSSPYDVSYDSVYSRLFVVDSSNHRALIFNVATGTVSNGMNASFVLGRPDFTTGSGDRGDYTTQNRFSVTAVATGKPAGTFYDSQNNRLFVSDNANRRIMIFSVATGTVTNGMNASDLLGQLDASGNPNYIKNFPYGAPDNIGLSGSQNGSSAYSSPNHYGTALDPTGHRLFASDFDNNRVLVYNLDANNDPIDHVADYVLGQADLYSNIAKANIDLGDTVGTQNGMNHPYGLAYDSVNNRLFVADSKNSRILIFNVATITNGMNASFVLGESDFATVTGGLTQSLMNIPSDVVYDSVNSRLFVAEPSSNARVLVFDVATGTVSNGMNASFVIGQANFTANTAVVSQNGMADPYTLAYDSAGSRLFVSDRSAHRITVYSVATGTVSNGMSASFVLGQANFTAGSSGRTQKLMNTPLGLAYDSGTNKLFVNDHANSRVLAFDVASGTIANGENAYAVFGQTNYTSGSSAVTQSGLANNSGVSYDSNNRRLFISDTQNNRILLYKFLTPGSTSFPSAATVGNSYSYTVPSSTDSQGIVTYSVVSGSVPQGLYFNGSTLMGTPTAAGVYSFSIQANDVGAWGSFSQSMSGTHTITVITNPGSAVLVGHSVVSGGGGGGGFSAPVASTTTSTATSTSATPAAAALSSRESLLAQIQILLTKVQELRDKLSGTQAATASKFIQDLQWGMKNNAEVRLLQTALTADGVYSGPITGNFLSQTYWAVVKFQTKHNISPAAGYVGTKTRAVLNGM